MRKISLTLIAAFFQMLSAFAQPDSNGYRARKLGIDEVNFVSGYYIQDGNHSAVTGGVGTEKLTDFANTLELKLLRTDKKLRTHNISVELGIDTYTSASSDNIDPNTVSSASYSDTRIYPTLGYTLTSAKKDLILGATASYSTEFDYKSYGIGLSAAKLSADKNRELALKLQGYFDTWKVIYPVELRPANGRMYTGNDDSYSPRNSFSASLSFSLVLNKRLQFAILADAIYQQGLLATKYQRVYFTDNSARVENLPDTRYKLPVGLRVNYFVGDHVILRAFYRYYLDNWGIKAHTIDLELPIKINPFLSVSPHYRFYSQSATDYFSPMGTHALSDVYYTSDYDLSAFTSNFAGAGIRFTPEKGILHIAHWTMLEIRYGHYLRSDGLHSDIISLNAQFK